MKLFLALIEVTWDVVEAGKTMGIPREGGGGLAKINPVNYLLFADGVDDVHRMDVARWSEDGQGEEGMGLGREENWEPDCQ